MNADNLATLNELHNIVSELSLLKAIGFGMTMVLAAILVNVHIIANRLPKPTEKK